MCKQVIDSLVLEVLYDACLSWSSPPAHRRTSSLVINYYLFSPSTFHCSHPFNSLAGNPPAQRRVYQGKWRDYTTLSLCRAQPPTPSRRSPRWTHQHVTWPGLGARTRSSAWCAACSSATRNGSQARAPGGSFIWQTVWRLRGSELVITQSVRQKWSRNWKRSDETRRDGNWLHVILFKWLSSGFPVSTLSKGRRSVSVCVCARAGVSSVLCVRVYLSVVVYLFLFIFRRARACVCGKKIEQGGRFIWLLYSFSCDVIARAVWKYYGWFF